MTKTEYAAYLASDHWRDLRKETLRTRDECERCLLPRWLAEIAYDQDLHLHHVTYARLGSEEPNDLEVLCPRCHELETFGRSELRTLKTARCEWCEGVHWDYRSRLCDFCARIFLANGGLGGWVKTLQRLEPHPEIWKKFKANGTAH